MRIRLSSVQTGYSSHFLSLAYAVASPLCVLIALALHEMPRSIRLAVLREARRLCAPEGRVLAIEHGRPVTRGSRLLRGLWWFFWIPGNPEVPTSRDLQEHGLDNEMRECSLKVIEHHTTQPDWIEAFSAMPSLGREADHHDA